MRKGIKKKTVVSKETKIKKNDLCYDCINAYLMRSDAVDPVVCECKITGERHVAKYNQCRIKHFERNKNEERTINPMILLK